MLGIDVCKKYIGLQEVRDNKQIKALLASKAIHSDIAIDPAVTSWCAAWANFCEREVGNHGTGKLNAQSFKTYGTAVDFDKAQEGDIVVFHFSFDQPWEGHVTYFVEDNGNNTLKCLGGNQHNMVDYANYIWDAVTDIRRP